MSEEENKAIARRYFEEVWNKRNLDAIEELSTKDIVTYGHAKDLRGPDDLKKFILGFQNAFPDMRFTIEEEIAEGDLVASRWVARGTHKGEFQGIPPTGNQIEVNGMEFMRIVDNKVVEVWGQPDLLALMQQIGAIPPPKQ